MGQLVIIAGKSGNGKSTSLRNMDPGSTFLIKAIDKPLPFPEKKKGWQKVDPNKGGGNYIVTDNSDTIINIIRKAVEKGFKSIVIDDATYTMINEMMHRVDESSFQKWLDIAHGVWRIADMVRHLPEDIIVYLIWHIEETTFGTTKLRTVGKLTDEKIDIPALATVVLLAERVEGKYLFRTQNKGTDIAKSPMGMFEEELIENDLKAVDEAIREYYN